MTKTTREHRHQNTKDAILKAAMDLIVEKGHNNLSLRQIARRIGYSPAGLYEYFDSKEDIIQSVCIQSEGRFLSYLKRANTDLPLDEYIVELGLTYIQYARENPQEFIFMFTYRRGDYQEAVLDPEQTPEENSFMVLYNAIQAAIDDGFIQTHPGYNTLEASYSLWSLVHGMSMLQVTYLDTLPNISINYPTADRTTLQALVKGLA